MEKDSDYGWTETDEAVFRGMERGRQEKRLAEKDAEIARLKASRDEFAEQLFKAMDRLAECHP